MVTTHNGRGLVDSLSKFWWVLLLRGLIAIAFGVAAIVWPGLTLWVLIVLFGAYTLVDGVLEIWAGFRNRGVHDRWWVDILIGIVGVVAGVLVISWPGLSALALIYIIAAWMVIIGVLQIITAIRMRAVIPNEWLLVLSGVLSVALGAIFFAFPGSGAVGLVWVIGIYAILFGVLLAILSFRLRSLGTS